MSYPLDDTEPHKFVGGQICNLAKLLDADTVIIGNQGMGKYSE
jgi:hypothetical protein